MYHQVPSALFPLTDAVPPLDNEPMISYTVPGPERTFTDEFAVTDGEHAVAEAGNVAAGGALATAVFAASVLATVAVLPPPCV